MALDMVYIKTCACSAFEEQQSLYAFTDRSVRWSVVVYISYKHTYYTAYTASRTFHNTHTHTHIRVQAHRLPHAAIHELKHTKTNAARSHSALAPAGAVRADHLLTTHVLSLLMQHAHPTTRLHKRLSRLAMQVIT